MRYRILDTYPAPLSLALCKQHLRVGDYCGDDEIILLKLNMAVGIAETFTGRLIRKRLILQTDDSNKTVVIVPPHTEKVISVSYWDRYFEEEIFRTTNIDWEGEESEELLCILDKRYLDCIVKVEAEVGYTEGSIPPALQAAILLILGTLYENESDQIIGRSVSELSLTAEKLLNQYRILPYSS